MRLFIGLWIACAAAAQSSPPAGLEPTWDVAVILEEIAKDAAALQPLLGQVDAAGWVSRGASATYGEQVQSSRAQAGAITAEARALARNPEKLSGALQLFFRLQGLETMLSSVEDGTRRYQTPQLAESLAEAFAHSGVNRERFRNYIINLAAEREQQFEVMDQEAQRCRTQLMALPPPPKSKPVAKKK